MQEVVDTGLTDKNCLAVYEGDYVSFDVLADDYAGPEFNQSGIVTIDVDDVIWLGEWNARYCTNLKKRGLL